MQFKEDGTKRRRRRRLSPMHLFISYYYVINAS